MDAMIPTRPSCTNVAAFPPAPRACIYICVDVCYSARYMCTCTTVLVYNMCRRIFFQTQFRKSTRGVYLSLNLRESLTTDEGLSP